MRRYGRTVRTLVCYGAGYLFFYQSLMGMETGEGDIRSKGEEVKNQITVWEGEIPRVEAEFCRN